MQLFHTAGRLSVSFDEPNLVGSAGLVPAMGLARRLGLVGLADQWLTVPGGRGTAGLNWSLWLRGWWRVPIRFRTWACYGTGR